MSNHRADTGNSVFGAIVVGVLILLPLVGFAVGEAAAGPTCGQSGVCLP